MSATTNALGAAAIIYFLIVLLAIGGWIANIVKIFGDLGDPITGFFIFRCVGVIVAPVGAILGFV